MGNVAMRRRVVPQSEWMAGRVATLPTSWAADLLDGWQGRAGGEVWGARFRGANVWLRETTESLNAVRIPLDASDAQICDIAQAQAAEVMALAGLVHGIGALREKAGAYVSRWGIEPPGLEYLDKPAIARMTCPLWWRRKLRVVHGRRVEENAIALGRVHKRREIYASDVTVKQREQQKRRNLKALENTIAHNVTTGQDFTLAELAEKAVSNPAIRRGELMVRMAGFEAVAKGLGHVGMFFTVTCPSRMHRMKTNERGAVFDNDKWDRTTPKEAAQYLSKVWARVRAAWKRLRLAPYGFRIAEPHHDGTPHWHLLLFMASEAVADVVRIFKDHATREDAGELKGRKAKKARFDVKRIDPRKGSAAGYIAKYVSKNIDGFQVQFDLEGEKLDAVTGSQRVEAWASRWGIRQFQQIGGPPVGVWRELRRLPKDGEYTATVAAARAATDKTEERQADWAGYVEVMGMAKPIERRFLVVDKEPRWSKPSKHGVIRPLPAKVRCRVVRHWPIEITRTRDGERFNPATGNPEPAVDEKGFPMFSRYGDAPKGQVFGLRDVRRGKGYMTRVYQWEIRRGNGVRGNEAVRVAKVGDVQLLQVFKGAEEVGEAIQGLGCCGEIFCDGNCGFGVEVGPGFPAPWSAVNNCTEGVEGGSDRGGKGINSRGIRCTEIGKSDVSAPG